MPIHEVELALDPLRRELTQLHSIVEEQKTQLQAVTRDLTEKNTAVINLQGITGQHDTPAALKEVQRLQKRNEEVTEQLRKTGEHRITLCRILSQDHARSWDGVTGVVLKKMGELTEARDKVRELERDRDEQNKVVIRVREEAQQNYEKWQAAEAKTAGTQTEQELRAEMQVLYQQLETANGVIRATSEEMGQLRRTHAAERLSLEADNKALRSQIAVVRDGLHWTGDGYEWSPVAGDYRMEFEHCLQQASAEYVSKRDLDAAVQAVRILRSALTPHARAEIALNSTNWVEEKYPVNHTS